MGPLGYTTVYADGGGCDAAAVVVRCTGAAAAVRITGRYPDAKLVAVVLVVVVVGCCGRGRAASCVCGGVGVEGGCCYLVCVSQ